MRTHMTKELYEISMKYQKRFQQLIELKVEQYDALMILFQDWKKEEIAGEFPFMKTLESVKFMLSMRSWYYQDNQGNLLDEVAIQKKHFVIA